MKTITILFAALLISAMCFAQDNQVLQTTSKLDTVVKTQTSPDNQVLTTTNVKNSTVSTTDVNVAPTTGKDAKGYTLVRPSAKNTYTSTDNRYYTGRTNMDDVYAAEWKQENPTYNQTVNRYYQNNSTSYFESEASQIRNGTKVVVTADLLQFLLATPYVKVY